MNQPAPFPTAPVPPKNSGLAVWSLVLGILSLTCFSIFSAVPAVICGHMAYSRIRQSAGALTGSGLAVGGLVTGYVSITLSVLLIPMMLAIAIPNFVKARQTAQMAGCVNNLRQIEGAKQLWAVEKKKLETDTPRAQELDSYLKNSFTSLKCPAGGVYTIGAVGVKPTCSIPEHHLPSD